MIVKQAVSGIEPGTACFTFSNQRCFTYDCLSHAPNSFSAIFPTSHSAFRRMVAVWFTNCFRVSYPSPPDGGVYMGKTNQNN